MTKKVPELRVRTTAEIKAGIEKLARQDGRSVNSYINRVLEREVKK
jgi:predicted HicB family RNase H-like nuclease